MAESLTLICLHFMLFFSHVFTSKAFTDFRQLNETSVSLKKMKLINVDLKKINKPFVKSIKSPDGDIIDCVLFNLQPAFDLAEIKENLSLDPPELPKGDDSTKMETGIKQLWNSRGESCPNGTIPIKRATTSDVLRSMSISKLGSNDLHEYALGSVPKGEYYGAKARLNVWKPKIVEYGFSLSQIWVVGEVPGHDLQSVEAGWHVYPGVNKDANPRLFIYWTNDGYKSGCYNVDCPGFVQTNTKIALGAAISPISTYNGKQFDITLMIWKDPKSENWWLTVGSETVGYWPKTLFTGLRDHATGLSFGGEVFSRNIGGGGGHTSTQMGSGHFPNEGFKKAAYIRNLQTVDKDNVLKAPVSGLNIHAEKPNCYDIMNRFSKDWGNHIYFGGPGKSSKCP